MADILLELIFAAFAILISVKKGRNKRGERVTLAYLTHFFIAFTGLLLIVGGGIADLLGIKGGVLEELGVYLTYLFAFATIIGAPILLVMTIICWRDKYVVMATLWYALFIVVAWFWTDDIELVTVIFLCYAIIAMYVVVRWLLAKRRIQEDIKVRIKQP